MSDKKHIDRVFQEKFKDFEASPKPEVWKGIQDKINQPKKDKKRVIPFWYRLAGVAALLLLLLTVGGLILNNSTNNSTNTKVVDTKNVSTEATNNTPISTNSNQKTNAKKIDNSHPESQKNNGILNSEEVLSKSQIASENSTKTKTYNKTSKEKQAKNSIANPSNIITSKNTRITDNTSPRTYLNTTEDLNKNNKAKSSHIRTKEHITNKNTIATNKTTHENETANFSEDFNKVSTEKQLQQLNNNATKNDVAIEENTEANIEEAVEEELNKSNLTIEEAIAATKDLIEEEKDDVINRWQVYANIAPVYYNSMGKGSHIDEQFSNNSKTGEVNTSYGVNVSYNFNKKLSIRTGLSSLKLSYDTNDVILYESVSNSNSSTTHLKNINLSNGNEGLTALSANNLSVGQIDNSLSPKSSAAISQRISYFEIPVELNYRIRSKKLGLNLIAGFSSFILDGNEVYSELNDEKTYIGEANNLKNMSFSTNFGVGLDYKFSEKVKFNLEPTFKYQINAFENTSGNFNPYIIGVYTGFSYKF